MFVLCVGPFTERNTYVCVLCHKILNSLHRVDKRQNNWPLFCSSCIYQNLGWKLCHQQGGHSGFCKYAIICCSIGDVPRALQSYCRHIDYNDYNYYKEYNDYSDFNDYNNYNDYRDSDFDLTTMTTVTTMTTITTMTAKTAT